MQVDAAFQIDNVMVRLSVLDSLRVSPWDPRDGRIIIRVGCPSAVGWTVTLCKSHSSSKLVCSKDFCGRRCYQHRLSLSLLVTFWNKSRRQDNLANPLDQVGAL